MGSKTFKMYVIPYFDLKKKKEKIALTPLLQNQLEFLIIKKIPGTLGCVYLLKTIHQKTEANTPM